MSRVPLIIDTDPGVDDLLAILLALGSPDVILEAITLAFGNTTLDYAHGNIKRLAHALNVAKQEGSIKNPTLLERIENGINGKPVPVGLGAEKPLGGRLFTASYFHGRDGMSGVSFLEGNPYPEATESKLLSTTPSDLSASDLILDVLKRHEPNTVRIAAVAPLTNVALAYQKDPETFRRVHSISVMGGALDVPGNTTPCAEFNFFADPWAAKLLIEQAQRDGPPLPIHLLPLDVTTIHTVPYSKLVLPEDHTLYKNSYLVRLISLFLHKPRSVTNSFAPKGVPFDAEKYDLFECHDPLAVAHAMYHGIHPGWDSAQRPFLVESEGELTRGFCVVDRRGHGDLYAGRSKADVESERGPQNEHGVLDDTEVRPVKIAKVDRNASPVPNVFTVTKTPGSHWFEDMLLGCIDMKQ
ncbi:Similar to S.cerevisiae protein URH1 (Uridine nucleosidase (uridine-cytidine N-ribohydrolase)) [Malassezia sympodialis ATCC 42132]|uniref:Similar to S.cerevisiae protein URH1 (Uridine nucleosidase (Uridine-cytidine N-ribohydrolase)) n=1 Tax=Malassezia sympodialis (strain ATCC 42132) TaxID=1230383 RepID=A0A1M8A3N8_MALS4|nr:Similar to S.cerevisiae protein URH1 (Uridine nucleosidase (uridine-cytidine N-ribohydrolase)) [Malassezia sympodialis ATCC 42132]